MSIEGFVRGFYRKFGLADDEEMIQESIRRCVVNPRYYSACLDDYTCLEGLNGILRFAAYDLYREYELREGTVGSLKPVDCRRSIKPRELLVSGTRFDTPGSIYMDPSYTSFPAEVDH